MNFTDKTCEPTPTSKLIEKYGYERLKFLSPKERLQEINEIIQLIKERNEICKNTKM